MKIIKITSNFTLTLWLAGFFFFSFFLSSEAEKNPTPIHFLLLIKFRVVGGSGAYPSDHGAGGRVHPGQFVSLLQGWHRETDNHAHSYSHLRSINLTCVFFELLEVFCAPTVKTLILSFSIIHFKITYCESIGLAVRGRVLLTTT